MSFLLANAYLAVGGVALLILVLWAVFAAAFLLLGGHRRPFLLGPVFAVTHIAAVITVSLVSPEDLTASPLAGIGWLFLCIADFPATLLFPRSMTDVSLTGFFIVFGTVQQALVGTIIAALYSRWRRKEPLPA